MLSQHSHNELYINNRWPVVSPRDDNAAHWGDTAVLLMSRVEEVVMDSVLGCLTLQLEQNNILKIWQRLKVCSKTRTCCQIWFVLMILNNDKVWKWRSSGVLQSCLPATVTSPAASVGLPLNIKNKNKKVEDTLCRQCGSSFC